MTPRFRTPSCTVAAGRLRPLALVSVFLLSVILALAAPAKFDIPAQPAPAALQLFMKQSGASVMYSADQLGKVRTAEVKGELEPLAALQQLLAGTDFNVRQEGPTSFVIEPVSTEPGSVEGSVQSESGRPVAGARVSLVGSNQTVLTDKRGRYTFDEVPAGSQSLAITAEGMQNTKVTDVNVKAGRRMTLSTIAMPVAAVGAVQLEDYVVNAKKNDGVVELAPYEVGASRERLFSANMDLPRTIDDPQPYYILDSKAIAQSGATDVQEFIKRRLTMDATWQRESQSTSPFGNVSTFNLRGLGIESTLVLVNGRRAAGVSIEGTDLQNDINGIPLAAIERIEVLPTSASGIYGGNAVGGVLNIVLKKDYDGGEVHTTYRNTWDKDASVRTVGLTYGRSFEQGRSHLLISAQYSDANSLLAQDREQVLNRGYYRLIQSDPFYIGYYPGFWSYPILGATPNVGSSDGVTNLTLKATGASLNAPFATIPQGHGSTSEVAGIRGGQWNLQLPSSNQASGLRSAIGSFPTTRSAQIAFRRQMFPNLELFAEGAESSNKSKTTFHGFAPAFGLSIASTVGTNPFNQDVVVNFPIDMEAPFTTESLTRSATIGVKYSLPSGWVSEVDYSWSSNEYKYQMIKPDEALYFAFINGTLNPFIDTLQYITEADLQPYKGHANFKGKTTLNDFVLRAAGPIGSLPAGRPHFAFSLQHRKERIGLSRSQSVYPITVSANETTIYFPRGQTVDSLYAEGKIPFFSKTNRRPAVEMFEVQIAVRMDRYDVNTGTTSVSYRPNQPPGPFNPQFNGPSVNGVPVFGGTAYRSTNPTFGIRWSPARNLIVRASHASGFLPPSHSQLQPNPAPDEYPSFITDPRNPALGSYSVETRSGGNPGLRPQTSKSWNAGVVWTPLGEGLRGMRVNIEYYKINQDDRISGLSPQEIVMAETTYGDRIQRDSTGRIVSVDASLLNLTKYETAGWDLGLNYRRKFSFGTLDFSSGGTVVKFERRQTAISSPLKDYLGFPNQGGAVAVKSYGALSLEHGNWTFGWNANYYGPYKQNGSADDPVTPNEASIIKAQGSSRVASQVYHNLFVGYAFSEKLGAASAGALIERLLAGVSLQIGLSNVFNKLPPFDVGNSSRRFYTSYYGDLRLREYSVSVRKRF